MLPRVERQLSFEEYLNIWDKKAVGHFKTIQCLVALVATAPITACDGSSHSINSRVQSEMIYLRDRLPLQTCWVSQPSTRRFSLNAYVFYYYEQDDDAPCDEELFGDHEYFAFDRQFQSVLAIRVIEDLRAWRTQNPDLTFLSAVSACETGDRALEIDLISFPAITRSSEFFVDFKILCPEPIDDVRARVGFSYDEQVTTLMAEDMALIWR